MGRRSVFATYIQVDVPPAIKAKLSQAANSLHDGNQSEYVRKWLYRGLLADGLLTPQELAAALVGIELDELIQFATQREEATP